MIKPPSWSIAHATFKNRNLVVTPSSSPTLSSSPLSPTVISASKSTTSSRASLIGGVVGGVIGGLVVILACVFCLRRHRRRGANQEEEHAIEEFRAMAPIPASLPNQNSTNASMSYKHTGNTLSSSASHISQRSTGVRPLPLPPQAPSPIAPAPPAAPNAAASDNLDRIIESLAERFGWTVPPPGVPVDSSPPGRHSVAPPEYS